MQIAEEIPSVLISEPLPSFIESNIPLELLARPPELLGEGNEQDNQMMNMQIDHKLVPNDLSAEFNSYYLDQ